MSKVWYLIGGNYDWGCGEVLGLYAQKRPVAKHLRTTFQSGGDGMKERII